MRQLKLQIGTPGCIAYCVTIGETKMDIVGRSFIAGGFSGAFVGFVLGAGPEIIQHFLPHFLVHNVSLYPWPIGVLTSGLPPLALFVLPGACMGAIVGTGLRSFRNRKSAELVKQTQADAVIWPPKPEQ